MKLKSSQHIQYRHCDCTRAEQKNSKIYDIIDSYLVNAYFSIENYFTSEKIIKQLKIFFRHKRDFRIEHGKRNEKKKLHLLRESNAAQCQNNM